jgi:sugar-specific transcriptional regulator TrmB
MTDDEPLEALELTEYETTVLRELLSLGRTTAPTLSEATGVPKARIYGVLESLGDAGFVKITPGRPKQYQPKSPDEILDRAVENRRQQFDQYRQRIERTREAFVSKYGPLYEQASEDTTPTEELFYVVDVGEPSERETRAAYRNAQRELNVLTKSFEYFDRVESSVADAIDRGVTVRVLFLHPRWLDPENAAVQAEIVSTIRETYPAVDLRYSAERLPWRGTLADPSMDYETGKAILLVEEKDIPLSMRQAAITENGSFVAGLKRYFDLVWANDSVADRDVDPDGAD